METMETTKITMLAALRKLNPAMTLRETAQGMIETVAREAAAYAHQQHYHRLHVRRDGSLTWMQALNKSDDLIDDRADHFAAIPSLGVWGTGSYRCNCNYCDTVIPLDGDGRWGIEVDDARYMTLDAAAKAAGDGGYDCAAEVAHTHDQEFAVLASVGTQEEMYAEAIADAVADGGWDEIAEGMRSSLDEIPVGYFDDEEEEEEK